MLLHGRLINTGRLHTRCRKSRIPASFIQRMTGISSLDMGIKAILLIASERGMYIDEYFINFASRANMEWDSTLDFPKSI